MTRGDQVDADPDAVRGLAVALARYQRAVTEAGRSVRGSLADARWNDRQKERFEERYRDLERTIDNFMNREVQEMIRSLNRLAHQLDEIRNMRM